MILEGLVTTTNPDGSPHLAPMGPMVGDDPRFRTFVLRPFRTSQTYRNLQHHGAGVLHITDDALLLARAAVGTVDPFPAIRPAERVMGYVLTDACQSLEFEIRDRDDTEERSRITAEVVYVGSGRPFFGFNRAKHAILEAAILATRLHLLPHAEVVAEYRKFRVIVDKTGGPAEREAMAFLEAHLARYPEVAS